MAYKNIVLSICTVSTALMLSACGGGSSSEKEVTSVFEDAPVQNLPYTCSPSNKIGQTNQNGEFTCSEGDKVSFQLGSTILGPIEAKTKDLVTPYKLFPKDEQKAIRLAQLLLSLDDDGNYVELITLDPNKLKEIIIENIDFDSKTFEEDAQALLDKDNLVLVNAETAKNHLRESDTEPPVVTLLGESTVTINVTANSTTDYMDAGATAYDAFEGALEVKRTGTVNTTVAGTYHYTYTATDKAGHSNSAIRTIIVKAVDTTPPVITLNGANPMSVNKGASFVDPGASATDDVDGSVSVKVSGEVNTNVVGEYTLTYRATDAAGNTAIKTRTVNVSMPDDVTPPVITLNGNDPMSVYTATTFTDPGASATDDVDGSVDVNVSGEVNTNVVGEYTLTYKATDAAGNTATKTRTVKVIECPSVNPITGQCEAEMNDDTQAPVITLNGNDPMSVYTATTFTDPGASATDDVDGSVDVNVSGEVNTNVAGEYTLTYRATDAAGNTATKTRTVKVIECPSVNPITGQCEAEMNDDTQAPVVSLNGDATVHVEGNSTYEDAGATATDNVDGALTPTMSENNVDTAVADTYSVVWSATDNAGNTGSATRTVIVDQEQCQVVNPITGLCED